MKPIQLSSKIMTIKFPVDQTKDFEKNNPIVMIGANGSGKTKLGEKIERINDAAHQECDKEYIKNCKNAPSMVHRLFAQKSLEFSNNIQVSGCSEASGKLFYGSPNHKTDKEFRYFDTSTGSTPRYIADYDILFSYLFATEQKELKAEHLEAREFNWQNEKKYTPNKTIVEKCIDVWNEFSPNRKIEIDDNEIYVYNGSQKYSGNEMSDGEKEILYMICLVHLLETDALLIIDEPEMHIHKAIIDKLWDKLEEIRSDCTFLYITHDLEFAISRNPKEVIWVKEFDGINWEYEFISLEENARLNDFPADLVLEILGTKENVLFVEGEKTSYDYFLYKEIYGPKKYHVIPCGSCEEVIKAVSAAKAYKGLDTKAIVGIIDRDYRTDKEIASYKTKQVYCLEVAEIENLFLVPELLDIMGEYFKTGSDYSKNAKDFIVEKFNVLKMEKKKEYIVRELNNKLKISDFSSTDLTQQNIEGKLLDIFSERSNKQILDEANQRFDKAKELIDILRILKEKGLVKEISKCFELKGNKYPDEVKKLMKNNEDLKAKMLNAFDKYVPKLD